MAQLTVRGRAGSRLDDATSEEDRREGEADGHRREGALKEDRREGALKEDRRDGVSEENRSEGTSDEHRGAGASDEHRGAGASDEHRGAGALNEHHREGASGERPRAGTSDEHPREGRKGERRREETRQRILAAAGRLFRAHGVDGVGVDAIMKEVGLTHGGFYLHFPSKEALAAEVSRTLLERARTKWDEISRSPDRDAALRQIVQYYLDHERVSSADCCPLTTLGPDVARRSTSREAISDALRGMVEALERVSPEQRLDNALALLSTMVGAVVLSRLADDPVLADAFLTSARNSILSSKAESLGAEPSDRQDG